MTTSPRARRREALRAARSAVPGPTSPRTPASAPHSAATAHPQAVTVPPEQPAAAPAPSTTSSRPSTRSVQADAAQQLRRLLAAVDAGELDATGAKGSALVRHLEGAVVALEASVGK